jgi:hypothetical protein
VRDISKLPKWAQQEITRLRGSVEHWQRVASVGPDESNTFADPYSDAPRPLGAGTTIEFVMTTGRKISVALERSSVSGMYDRLYINGDDSIAVFPSAANACSIQVLRMRG